MGSTHPYYRRSKPNPQSEKDFARDISLRQVVQQLRDQGTLSQGATISVKELNQRFQPVPSGSMQSLLLKMFAIAYPIDINLVNAHIEPNEDISLKQIVQRLRDKVPWSQGATISVKELNQRFQLVPSGSMRSLLLLLKLLTNSLFDNRAAAAIYAAVSPQRGIRVYPNVKWKPLEVTGLPPGPDVPFHVDDNTGDVSNSPGKDLFSDIDLLEMKFYGNTAPTVYIALSKCLAAIAYLDYFPDSLHNYLSGMVSQAILAANYGWCGTFGPGVDNFAVISGRTTEGNYDMSQMRLLPIAYRYYDKLSVEAREHLITALLERGRIHRPNSGDIFTSGGAPNDWSGAGSVNLGDPVGVLLGIEAKIRIGETENHILMIHTTRYLTNQLLYQRDHHPDHDNRRNGGDYSPSCTDLMLYLLRNILRGDFSEYNAKPYQVETRAALLNLCSYAYDHEVRLAARMVLDYISAHIAVSSNDLRRMVPFRRRNEGEKVTHPDGFMAIDLLEPSLGADPMAEPFAMQTGNTRAYEKASQDRPFPWSIASNGEDSVMEVLSDYRLPFSIHDLFVNDLHRRFFQRLHRIPQDNVEVTGRNCDNHEIYAGSPSYLITAGGSPATYAIDPTVLGVVVGDQAQQLGVAVTTSFLPTGSSAGSGTQNNAKDLIQFSSFSDSPGKMLNYGVAPDFACGHRVHLPDWCLQAIVVQRRGKFDFVDKRGADGCPGFYLALLRDGDFAVMEAFDTWLRPDLTFEQFKSNVWERNKQLSERGLRSNVEAQYTTENGNRLHFVIWKNGEGDNVTYDGARILSIEYGTEAPKNSLEDAGFATDQFLRGTVMKSLGEGVVEITNHFLDTRITLDMSDQWHPKRTSETGEVEEAGSNHEVWVDFDWSGPSEGDFFHPFKGVSDAVEAVADGGTIKIMPGSSQDRVPFHGNGKRVRITAPIGGVKIGAV